MFKFLKKIKDAIMGYKTYAVCVISIVSALIAWSEGAITVVELYTAIMAALAGISIRAGMKEPA